MSKVKPALHYIVRFSHFDYKSPDLIDFKFHEKEFYNDDPIVARQQAFSWYENESHIRLLSKGLNDSDAEKLTAKDLQDYYNGFKTIAATSPDNRISEWKLENADLAAKATSYGHPELLLIIDDETILNEENRYHKLFINSKELPIYKIVDLDDPYDVSEYMLNLDQEYAIYKYFNYNTNKLEQDISFFDPESVEGEKQLEKHTILPTPFDWQGYEQPNWWKSEDVIEDISDDLHPEETKGWRKSLFDILQSETHEEIIAKGEGHVIEFKPCLFAQVEKRNIKREIFNVICSFLNSNGGYIYLGVNDHGFPIGVDLKKKNKDEYKREFTRLKNWYFENGISSSNIIGDFTKIEGRDVFWIRVTPSFFEPVYLISRVNRYDNTVHENNHFFVRQEASTHEIKDPKILIEYVKNKWFSKH